jgi:WD40 repeat protein
VGHTKKVESIAVTTSSEYIASCSLDKTVRLWNLNRNSIEAVLYDDKYEIYSVSFSNDDKYLLAGSNTVRVYEVKNKRLIFKLERDSSYRTEYVYTVRMSRDNQYIFFKSYYDNLYLCKFNTIHKYIKALTNSGNLYCMDLSSDDSLIAYARYDNCRSSLRVCQFGLISNNL